MTIQNGNRFENYLQKFSESDWQAASDSLLPSIHEVDRSAMLIWFRFYPIALDRYLAAPDSEELKRNIAMQGDFGLSNAIDTSHYFLYGHRFWKTVKAAIQAESQVFENDNIVLAEEISQIAAMVAEKVKVDASLLTGITAVAFMTLNQVGIDKFLATPGETEKPSGLLKRSPESIVSARKQNDSQGLFGFLKTVNQTYSVIHDESTNNRFAILNDQEIASASGNDRSQNWQEEDPRCWEGPVPVECTSASCGTCWIGVIAGSEKLSEVAPRERRAVKVFGYEQTEDDKPLIRLACQARAFGNITIVIPPWNAVFGKKVYGNVEELDLEPVTTSAKALRQTIRDAAAGESPD